MLHRITCDNNGIWSWLKWWIKHTYLAVMMNAYLLILLKIFWRADYTVRVFQWFGAWIILSPTPQKYLRLVTISTENVSNLWMLVFSANNVSNSSTVKILYSTCISSCLGFVIKYYIELCMGRLKQKSVLYSPYSTRNASGVLYWHTAT